MGLQHSLKVGVLLLLLVLCYTVCLHTAAVADANGDVRHT
jgi:hypothetical protein